ncbi:MULTISPECIES: hypothetical protein [unclassified Mycolicibacterium]|uniref:hypothetical protein n=1 Tax=unclassified Mycolicibacterium TaxID=2636767 RepID=UPI001EE400E3|nr:MULTISPECIES: hypothetical protein [unclassified Mycolicibacterium]MUM04001.1 hypothetical protein [Mycolicibacterium sp. CBMA 213]
MIATCTGSDGYFGAMVAFALVAGTCWLLAYTLAARGGTIEEVREKRFGFAIVSGATTVAMIAIIVYQLSQSLSAFVWVSTVVAFGAILVAWLVAVVHRARGGIARPEIVDMEG